MVDKININSSININPKKDKFFISINKQEVHSFVMIGVYNQHKVQHVLCRVGKGAQLALNERTCTGILKAQCRVLFSNHPAQLYNEGVYHESKQHKSINYQAYDITFVQYMEFLKVLAGLQTQPDQFPCFQPANEQTSENIVLEYKSLIATKKTVEQIRATTTGLSINNTCRHTAIKLVEEVQQSPISSEVSSLYFYNLPYQTYLKHGKPTKHIPFYVLPVTPIAYVHLGEQKVRVLQTLYKRMEKLLALAPEAAETVEKFDCLKDLYNQIAGPRSEMSLNELLNCVKQWKQDNSKVLSTLRKYTFLDFFWWNRKSATMKMVDEIEQYLSSKTTTLGK
ncbi:MAG: hypothetical protein QM652_10290 [Legionella sp.]|uniref:hypothetical protein n=1 Tax=Legionella sp. TaxID=459 RepID=UPI0039E25EA9